MSNAYRNGYLNLDVKKINTSILIRFCAMRVCHFWFHLGQMITCAQKFPFIKCNEGTNEIAEIQFVLLNELICTIIFRSVNASM